MIVSSNGMLKVTDFGLAKGQGDVRLSQSGAPLGSYWYMSPEQVQGAASDARSDIYSLGAVLYELTTGKKPFDGGSAFEVMAQQVGKVPVPPIEVDPTVPVALSDAILRALKKDPGERFQTVVEFRQVLQGPPTMAETAPRFSISLWIAAAVACVGIVTAGTLGYLWLHAPVAPPATASIPVPLPESPQASIPAAAAPKIVVRTAPKTIPQQPADPLLTQPEPSPRETAPQQPPSEAARPNPNIFKKVFRHIWPGSKRTTPPLADQ
jgi:serine/threonine-protein kinase